MLKWYLNTDTSIRTNENYEVANLGVNGFEGKQSLLRVKAIVSKLGSPKYLLYLGCDNDYQDNILFEAGYKHKYLVVNNPYWGIYYKPIKFLFQDLHTGRYVKSFVSTLRRKKIIEKDTVNISVANQEENLLNELRDYCRKNEITLIVSWVVENNTDSYSWLKKWSDKSNVYFVDWIPKVDDFQDIYPNFSMTNPHSAGHYRTWVNQIIAEMYHYEISKIENQFY